MSYYEIRAVCPCGLENTRDVGNEPKDGDVFSFVCKDPSCRNKFYSKYFFEITHSVTMKKPYDTKQANRTSW